MYYRTTQQLSTKGFIGACLFVIAPCLGGFLWQTSMAEYLSALRSYGADSLLTSSKLYPPGAYILLGALSMVGLVMVISGREYMTDQIAERTDEPTND